MRGERPKHSDTMERYRRLRADGICTACGWRLTVRAKCVECSLSLDHRPVDPVRERRVRNYAEQFERIVMAGEPAGMGIIYEEKIYG